MSGGLFQCFQFQGVKFEHHNNAIWASLLFRPSQTTHMEEDWVMQKAQELRVTQAWVWTLLHHLLGEKKKKTFSVELLWVSFGFRSQSVSIKIQELIHIYKAECEPGIKYVLNKRAPSARLHYCQKCTCSTMGFLGLEAQEGWFQAMVLCFYFIGLDRASLRLKVLM